MLLRKLKTKNLSNKESAQNDKCYFVRFFMALLLKIRSVF
jgi:hypothetical protein